MKKFFFNLVFLSIVGLNAQSQIDSSIEKESIVDDSDAVFLIPQQMPVFPGGVVKEKEFIQEHLIFPESFTGEKEFRVYITFIVEKDGKISNIKVKESPGEEYSQAAIEVIEKMPDWIPGRVRGPARVIVTTRIRFAADRKQSNPLPAGYNGRK